ncbi:hypothetical protein PJI16_00240 [Nitrospira sp. MA-1]|nr:hypothetical protein [Nitrospira sp. MA-1]
MLFDEEVSSVISGGEFMGKRKKCLLTPGWEVYPRIFNDIFVDVRVKGPDCFQNQEIWKMNLFLQRRETLIETVPEKVSAL